MPNVAERVDASSIVFERSACVRQVKLKCPLCFRDATLDRELASYAKIRCSGCAEVSEFRQFRETWCASQREMLTRACPEIRFPNDRLAHDRR